MVKVTLDAETFKALASPTRLGVMRALDERRKTVSELARDLEMNKATIHEHLQLLTASGLVNKIDEGRKWIYYELTWRGERILHPQETTTFNLLLGISVAAAGGGVMMMGRALGWWLHEQASRIPEQDLRGLEAANATEELPPGEDERAFTSMDDDGATTEGASAPADPSPTPTPTSTQTTSPSTTSTSSGTSAPSTTATTTSAPSTTAAPSAASGGDTTVDVSTSGMADRADDDRTLNASQSAQGPESGGDAAADSDGGLADLSDDGLLALLLLAFSLLTSILALSLRRRLTSRPARPDEQPPEATGDDGLDAGAEPTDAQAPTEGVGEDTDAPGDATPPAAEGPGDHAPDEEPAAPSDDEARP